MFNSGSNYPSLSDIAAVTGNDGLGGNNGWWVLIILLALFGGFNGNGYNRGGSVQENYVLASDFSNIERKIDGVNNGLCDGFYAQNTNTLNGFANVNATLAQLSASLTQLIMQGNANLAAGQTDIGNKIQSTGCELKQAIGDLKYTMAADTNAITTAINTAAQTIMQNDNNNYRSLHDEFVSFKMEQKDAQIAELTRKLSILESKAGCGCNSGCGC